MFGLNVYLPKECLKTPNRSLFDHELHENSLFVEGLAHLLQVDRTDLFPENGLEKFHQKRHLALYPVSTEIQKAFQENPSCFTPLVSNRIHVLKDELLLVLLSFHF